ncbi:MAG: hypothetical protein ABW061_11570, partial [Polyangiaceae bacterium]
MTQRRALVALGILIIVVASVVAARRYVKRTTPVVPSASVRAAPKPAPVLSGSPSLALSASAAPAASGASGASGPPQRERPPYLDTTAKTLPEQRAALFTNMRNQLDLPPGAQDKIEAIFALSDHLGQGEPKITKHPMTRAECREIRATHPDAHPADTRCGAQYMVPLFDPAKGETAATANVCMDQFEFPNIPCEYPVTWVRSSEAYDICAAEGKRLCDAHEWEGACAGALHTPDVDYTFGERRIMQEYLHNKTREMIWAYGPKADQKKCA